MLFHAHKHDLNLTDSKSSSQLVFHVLDKLAERYVGWWWGGGGR